MIFNSLLKISSSTLDVYQFRNRATYYKQSNGWTPKFLRRFLIRYPRGPYYIVTGILVGSMIAPVFYWIFKYYTMSFDEFKDYRTNYNKNVIKRQRFGEGLIFPWKSKETDEEK
ncbi:Hypothetical protein SRAE_2000226300 [Strongyloides ratti]|uniref:Uncharacterized protein n=1 Tax=Strongyloides ratti TaxID=34506 RepID=A0A090LCU2_STRRB|nr:Hypothetical protein SRAE_2000226300 [Strongyloides ratti]CEF67601.1 Hypothetical protein SRAE_2000226300 [Strongyloides ratti]